MKLFAGLARLTALFVAPIRRVGLIVVDAFRMEHARPPMRYDWFTADEAHGLERSAAGPGVERIDDTTWRDLDVDTFVQRIAGAHSLLARQMLLLLLRRGAPADAAHFGPAQAETPIPAPLRADAEASIAELRRIDVDLTGVLHRGALEHVASWSARLAVVPAVATALLLHALIAKTALALWLLGAFFVFNGWVQIRLYRKLTVWKQHRDALLVMLRAAMRIAAHPQAAAHPLFAELSGLRAQIQRAQAALTPPWLERLPGLYEYLNLFALIEYARFGRNTRNLIGMLPTVATIHRSLARSEAHWCLAEYWRSSDLRCWSRPSSQRRIEFTAMVHPLVASPEPISLAWGPNGALITGRNGIGKSTLLRAIGLNLLCARAFGFFHARCALVPVGPVMTSLQHEDSIASARSLYMAEMQRARQLFDAANASARTVFLIDEVFRGTNNVESMAAATAVLGALAKTHLTIATTHNVLLAPLLQAHFEAWRLEHAAPGTAMLRLEPGTLVDTNGVAMLRQFGFPDAVCEHAQRAQSWLAGYLNPTPPD